MKTFYNFISIIIIVFFCAFSTHASPLKIVWHTGQMSFWNKTTIEGELSYNWLAEMVMIRQLDGRVYTFSADQVSQFGWFDYSQHKYRNFISIQNTANKVRVNNTFFEVCMDGSLTIVRRLRRPHGLWKRAFGHPANYSDTPIMAQTTDHFDYFVYDATHLVTLNRFYTDIYTPLMTAYDRELQAYVMRHNLNTRTLLGRLVLVDHYNFLVQRDARTASARSIGNTPN